MQNHSDAQLLRQYAAQRSEVAFSEIVARHAGLVYSAALRQLESSELARDVAQSVFTDLARKAPSLADQLSGDASLAGWLYRSTRFAARDATRGDRRRQARERQVMEHLDTTTETAPQWEQVRPVLDEAMAELSDEDREAVLLRYLEQQDLHAVGQALGVSADAAQKRVSRALERLRTGLASRGVTTTAGALSALLVAETVSFAPVGLAATLSLTALAGTTLTVTATATVTKAIAMTALQKTLIAATLAAAVGTGIYEARQSAQLREENQSLRQQQAPLAEQNEKLSRERDDARRQLAAFGDDNARLNQNTAELMRLRGEVATLRTQSNELDSLRKQNAQLQQRARSLVASNQETNQLPVVAKIIITRAAQPRLVSEDQVRANISVKVGDVFDRAIADRDVRDLFASGLFRNVLIKEHKVVKGFILEYIVQEKPKLTGIRFAGNNNYRDADLNRLIESKVGEALDDRRIYSEARKIEELYVKSGFTSTRVKSVLNINEDTGEGDVVFEISE